MLNLPKLPSNIEKGSEKAVPMEVGKTKQLENV